METTVLLLGLLGKTWLLPLEYLVCRKWLISCLRKEHEDRLRSYWEGSKGLSVDVISIHVHFSPQTFSGLAFVCFLDFFGST